MQVGVGTAAAALQVPDTMRQQLDAAVAEGREEAAGWARIHPFGSMERFRRDSLASITAPPSGAALEAELQVVRDAERSRTPDGTERARDHAHDAGWGTWQQVLRDIGRAQGAEQARHAERLMRQSVARTDAIVAEGKRTWGRLRPYQEDPRITIVVPDPHGNASYPSGHASGAYAAALVLAAFVPERAAELVDLAAEVAWSRVYGGVHFPSDVVTGARIASRVAADVLRRDAEGIRHLHAA